MENYKEIIHFPFCDFTFSELNKWKGVKDSTAHHDKMNSNIDGDRQTIYYYLAIQDYSKANDLLKKYKFSNDGQFLFLRYRCKIELLDERGAKLSKHYNKDSKCSEILWNSCILCHKPAIYELIKLIMDVPIFAKQNQITFTFSQDAWEKYCNDLNFYETFKKVLLATLCTNDPELLYFNIWITNITLLKREIKNVTYYIMKKCRRDDSNFLAKLVTVSKQMPIDDILGISFSFFLDFVYYLTTDQQVAYCHDLVIEAIQKKLRQLDFAITWTLLYGSFNDTAWLPNCKIFSNFVKYSREQCEIHLWGNGEHAGIHLIYVLSSIDRLNNNKPQIDLNTISKTSIIRIFKEAYLVFNPKILVSLVSHVSQNSFKFNKMDRQTLNQSSSNLINIIANYFGNKNQFELHTCYVRATLFDVLIYYGLHLPAMCAFGVDFGNIKQSVSHLNILTKLAVLEWRFNTGKITFLIYCNVINLLTTKNKYCDIFLEGLDELDEDEYSNLQHDATELMSQISFCMYVDYNVMDYILTLLKNIQTFIQTHQEFIDAHNYYKPGGEGYVTANKSFSLNLAILS